MSSSAAFVRSSLPDPPARVLEVGCGEGALALALAGSGYTVTAIDPQAPEGPIFQRLKLEEFDDASVYDAVIMIVSLHHVDDLAGALDHVLGLLRPGGVLVLDEFAKEHLQGATARWYWRQRQAFAAVGEAHAPIPDDFAAWLAGIEDTLAHVHEFRAIRREVDARFVERFFERLPYLYRWGLDDALAPLERKLIEAGAIEATGVRYVGERSG
jgi:ubiquinone/menaquinone biosynthesis C-methylase UbiE